jgi:hypothetical protein
MKSSTLLSDMETTCFATEVTRLLAVRNIKVRFNLLLSDALKEALNLSNF